MACICQTLKQRVRSLSSRNEIGGKIAVRVAGILAHHGRPQKVFSQANIRQSPCRGAEPPRRSTPMPRKSHSRVLDEAKARRRLAHPVCDLVTRPQVEGQVASNPLTWRQCAPCAHQTQGRMSRRREEVDRVAQEGSPNRLFNLMRTNSRRSAWIGLNCSHSDWVTIAGPADNPNGV